MDDDSKVKADTPDPTKYFKNLGKIPGTTIPRSDFEGTSLGFDHNKPRTVIVDPGVSGGGFEVDMASFSDHKEMFNSAASKKSVRSDVSDFYRQMSRDGLQVPVSPSPAVPTVSPTMTNAKLETIPLPPVWGDKNFQSQSDSQQDTVLQVDSELQARAQIADELRRRALTSEQQMASLLSELAVANETTTVEKEAQKMFELFLAQQRAKTVVQQTTPTLDHQLLQQVAAQTRVINSLIQKVNELSAVERPVAPKQAEIEPQVSDAPAFQPPARQCCEIDFLDHGPTRPEYEVYFELSKMGTMAARYHTVVAGNSCLALIYDTRFRDGFQYLPPNLEEERIRLTVPKNGAIYVCSSLGLHWSIGCLDVVILLLHGTEKK